MRVRMRIGGATCVVEDLIAEQLLQLLSFLNNDIIWLGFCHRSLYYRWPMLVPATPTGFFDGLRSLLAYVIHDRRERRPVVGVG